MGKFEKHIGQGEKVEIDGEEFILKPLSVEFAGHFLKIGKGFSGSKSDGDLDGMFKNFTDETIESIKIVVTETLKKSYPDEPKEDMEIFAGKYLMKLLPVIAKLNGQADDEDSQGRGKKKIEALQRLKTKQDEPESTNK